MEPPPTPGQMLAQITRDLVHLHTEYYGKGPTKAKSYLVTDMVVSVLHQGFTAVERTLIDDDETDPVRQMRRQFQTTMKDRFVSVVEAQTGRKVIAYMSEVHFNPDVAVELFMLEPSAEAIMAEHEEKVEVGESG